MSEHVEFGGRSYRSIDIRAADTRSSTRHIMAKRPCSRYAQRVAAGEVASHAPMTKPDIRTPLPGADQARLRPALRGRTRNTRVCTQPGCPELTTTGRCPTHQREHDQARGTTTQRGYGADHQATRARLLPNAIGKPCPICNQPMQPDQQLALDHTIPLAHDPASRGDRITHAHCNNQAGAIIRRAS